MTNVGRIALVFAVALVLFAIGTVRLNWHKVCTPSFKVRVASCSQVSRLDIAVSRGDWFHSSDFTSTIMEASVKAAVEPRLLLAVLIRESGDQHWTDWLSPTPVGRLLGFSIGVSNMKRSAFEEARGYSGGVIDYQWETIRHDPEKAIRAASFLLAKRQSQLEPGRSGRLSDAQYLRVGYRAGFEVMNAAEQTGHYQQGTELFDLAYQTAGRLLPGMTGPRLADAPVVTL